MRQLLQQLSSGKMSVQEVPAPCRFAGGVLVRNHFSLISAGTEGSTVRTARKSILAKARERPEQVRQVIQVAASQGPLQAYRAVSKRLGAYSPLGYSCAGEVLEVGAGVTSIAVGDRVACAGALYANHAEVVVVPENLCVALQPDAGLRKASYNTLGAIALQGIRQSKLTLGESCAVIGLGLIGQLTCLMLRAAGVRVVGIDVDDDRVRLTRSQAADLALVRRTPGIEARITDFAGGLGVDAVVITAGTDSLDPINFAGALARKKGRVVVVGAVPTGFDRDPHYYRKELELRMSCSYGPGRYDPTYEEKGVDYPPAYVRWTEKRNMQAFQELLYSDRIDIGYLTTHEFALEDAPSAYDMILEPTEPFLGMVIRYPVDKPVSLGAVSVGERERPGASGIAFVGAGSYAQGSLLPNLPGAKSELARRVVLTTTGATAKRVAERFAFELATTDERDVFESPDVGVVFVATRHDSHAGYVAKALEAGKHVFVEKPLALTLDELDRIAGLIRQPPGDVAPTLMVGFNRRFAPLVETLKDAIGEGPVAMQYRVNAGAIPQDSWIQDRDVGGGRIVGEVCHFIDLMTFLCGSLPTRVYATSLPDAYGHHDTVNIILDFANGSIGSVAYLANGSRSLYKERLEVSWQGCSAVLRDFRRLEIYSPKRRVYRRASQDKGQRAMVASFLHAVSRGEAPPIAMEEAIMVSRATLCAVDSLREQRPVDLR